MNRDSRVGDVTSFLDSEVVWEADPDDLMWLRARKDGCAAYMRINDFPERNMYSLWIGDGKFVELEDLPPRWKRVGRLAWPDTARRDTFREDRTGR